MYEFTELIEDEPGPGAIASHGIDPYLTDFAAVVSFALDVTCTPDPELTFRLLNGRPGPSVQYPPSRLVRRVFDDMVFCQPADEVQLFELVGQLISLKRKSFLAAMRAIRSYVTGLHRLADDYELAYTLLVVSIESLAQEFDDFQLRVGRLRATEAHRNGPGSGRRRRGVGRPGQGNPSGNGARRPKPTFREFTMDHLRPSYFRAEAHGLTNPAGRADLDSALRQAYNLRSRYIHELGELPKMLKLAIPGDTASLPFRRDVLLTFQGLARLARHVITTFIQRQPKAAREEYDYSQERAGILEAEMAPKYWIGDVAGLDRDSDENAWKAF